MAPNQKPNLFAVIAIPVIIVIIFLFSGASAFFVDYLWFDSLGFSVLFMTALKSKVTFFFIGALIFLGFASLNLFVSSKLHPAKGLSLKAKLGLALGISVLFGMAASSSWFRILEYINRVPFSVQDPLFLKDVAFYIFELPIFLSVLKFAMATLVVSTLLVLLDYLQTGLASMFRPGAERNFDPVKEVPKKTQFNIGGFFSSMKRSASVHLSILAALFFVLLSVYHYLARFSIMYSEEGIVVGAGYADVVAFLPVVKFLVFLAIVVALVFVIWALYFSKKKKFAKHHIVMIAVAIYLAVNFIGPTLIPGLVQNFRVDPNEINLESPYIENNIHFTRLAYGLDDVEERDFNVSSKLTRDVIEASKGTVDNIRILDWRPLTQTYKQMQGIRLYYDLSGVDIDRYNIGSKYTQVMLAPRELDQSFIAGNAKTWMNLHMVYSHGFGVVMSPVNKVTDQGLPSFLIQDIPPKYFVDEPSLRIDRPQVYYGETRNGYMIVNTETAEFDYPRGNTNAYTNYDGEGGIKLNSFFTKVIMALRFGDIKILLSSEISEESKLMMYRDIASRVSKLTPFLKLDADPYIVIADGHLKWVQDAYTVTGNYPYSEKFNGFNYIRNSVKVVVDAYDGTVDYYVADSSDPLVMTYSRIFPGVFKPLSEMPESLKSHLRYPEDLFKIQSAVYSTYHMDDPKVFYNKEDAWQIPFEIYGVGQKIKVEPYYVLMKLPGSSSEEFMLMTSFTPVRKDNMIAWMAARSDVPNYGGLVLFKFPKDKLIYGPLQIEAKIDQDSEISQQLTLWSQQGSSVARGNLLVIPIDDSILYVEPLYIMSEKGQLPELKRVIVSDGERVVMEENLNLAIESLFGAVTEKSKESSSGLGTAQDYYEKVLDAMRENDWVSMGENFEKLGEALDALKE